LGFESSIFLDEWIKEAWWSQSFHEEE